MFNYITIVNGTCPGALNEVSMERIFECKNGKIYVEVPESCDREKLRKVTEDFLKKVLSGGNKYEYINTSTNFRKK